MRRPFSIVLTISLTLIAVLFTISLTGNGSIDYSSPFKSAVVAADSLKDSNPQYVGAKKCRICHLDIYKSWQSTAHAEAMHSLEPEHTRDSACVRCHITGIKDDGTIIENVGCEACHGPGSEYRKMRVMKNRQLAIEKGLVVQSEAVCIRCHNEDSPDFKGFDYSTIDLGDIHLMPSAEK
jgi:hypothetical protein